ncbi:hypothetical protein FDP41_001113 [Naegleria fowleri]|uniref:Uncharacterized protein n=1 Tax=Naegleria fowleri TaxID=5763 RepID=A0A6A5C277_NAEFO|nr:uncharacterized protein FDP41_001113 [Naegleria fowleri]KAF0979960.1 hypothetical protein FDP41_001113 [Naegleria fowleri]CAG4719538.1 unnamed protein product [Naegleria fowleri]
MTQTTPGRAFSSSAIGNSPNLNTTSLNTPATPNSTNNTPRTPRSNSITGANNNSITSPPIIETIIKTQIPLSIRELDEEIILQKLFCLCCMSGSNGRRASDLLSRTPVNNNVPIFDDQTDQKLSIGVSQNDQTFINLLTALNNINPKFVNRQDYLGRTLLMNAIINEHFSYITTLLSFKSVDVTIKTFNTQKTAYMFAAEKGFTDQALKILKYSDVNDCDASGKTLLMYSIEYYSLVHELIKRKANLSAKDSQGRTCLMFALSKMDKSKNPFYQQSLHQVIDILISNATDLSETDNEGRDLKEYISKTENKDIIQKFNSKLVELKKAQN